MPAFTYERPSTIEAAVEMMGSAGAYALGGGTDLIPQLHERRRSARLIVDLKHVPDLTAITRLDDGGWRIGAAASVRRIGDDAGLRRAYPGLIEAARLIGSLQIQSRASLGGNLANGAPSADAVPLLICLGAMAEIAGPTQRRHLPVESIPEGPGRSILRPGEVIVALLLPARSPRSAARYLRFTPRREMDIAIAGSGVAIELGDGGEIIKARITLASVAPVPLRAPSAEAHLVGARPDVSVLAEAARLAASEARPISDTRGSADYRRELVGVLTRRALEACIGEATARGAGA
ncbi:MAG: xanthine dehydrogenase family protein subunit M [Hyphomicrobiaceae bacterium]